ncbi:hypothetical protein STEG23_032857, partial [Scotinomys teguina]
DTRLLYLPFDDNTSWFFGFTVFGDLDFLYLVAHIFPQIRDLSFIPSLIHSFLKRFLYLYCIVRSGFGASENHCLYLEGTCRRDVCKVIEDEIGACRRRWKCCRMWWVLVPIPTPVVFSDYQEPLKTKIK